MSSDTPTVAVVGAGAVGSLLAARLHAAGVPVTLCSRRPLRDVTVEDVRGRRRHDLPVITDPADAPSVDWVLLTVKAHQTAGARLWLDALGGTVAAVQNGLDQDVLAYTHVVPVAPGHVRHVEGECFLVPAGAGVATVLRLAGFDVVEADDFHTARWRKLLGNVAANPVTAITGRRGEVLHDPEVLALLAALMRECVAVARADGADLGEADVETLLEHFRTYPADGGTSMLWDRLAGRPLEHEALTGALVEVADRRGVPVPRHRVLLALLRALTASDHYRNPEAD